MSLSDVARLAGVSVATASLILRGVKRFSPEIERRVRRAAKELDYRPNRAARALRTGESQTIGVLAPNITNPFFPGLMKGLEAVARSHGYALLLMDTNESRDEERDAVLTLEAYGVDGIIWVPVAEEVDQRPTAPVVVVDRAMEGFDSVRADHEMGGRLIARHALELGHRDVGYVAGPEELSSARARREGLMAALSAAGLRVRWETFEPFGTTLGPATTSRLAQREVTVVLCGNDLQAIAVTRALRDLGLRVPNDVSVGGFDDIVFAQLHEPPLTTVRQPVAAIAEEALRLLLTRIQSPDLEARSVSLAVELCERASVTRVPADTLTGPRGTRA